MTVTPILSDPCDNPISSPNGSNLEWGTITSQSEGINDETGFPLTTEESII